MGFLIEDVYRKIVKYGEGSGGSSWHFKLAIKITSIIILLGAIVFIGYSFLSNNYLFVVVFLGALLIAEASHYLRKSREVSLKNNDLKNQNLKNNKKIKNLNNSSNSNTLGKTNKKSKKNLNQIPTPSTPIIPKPKTKPTKKAPLIKSAKQPKNIINAKIKFPTPNPKSLKSTKNPSTNKPKNKDLLGLNKPKNKDLLE